MKIKVKEKNYAYAMKSKAYENKKPRKQSSALRKLVQFIAKNDLKDFTLHKVNMDKLSDEPCLIFMNHSSFIDLEMVFHIFKDRKFSIIATDDGFIGKEGLLRGLGCIPTRKFMYDTVMVRNMMHSLNKLHQSVLMYPEASYTFDGTETPLPKSIGKCIKLCKVPVVVIKSDCGNFLRDPLYNNLQIRQVRLEATMECILTKGDIEKLSVDEIQKTLEKSFVYNHFEEQKKKGILIKEDFRADYLNRILYKCPKCFHEGNTIGKGTTLTCKDCGHEVTLLEDGTLSDSFSFVPDWYKWEREEVKKEIEENTYSIHEEVEIYVFRNYSCLYHIGDGVLDINKERYLLTHKGEQIFSMVTSDQYSLYSDYYWYELGDMICIGDKTTRFYCVMKGKKDVVAKARLAQEEIYKLKEKR